MATQTLYEVRDGTAQSTDAVTNVPTVTFDVSTGGPGGTALTNCVLFIQGDSEGFSTTNTAAGGRVSALFKVVGGTLSKVGNTAVNVTMIKDTGGAPANDFSVSGNVITFYVNGVAGVTINWFCKMYITIYQPT